jgi:hypothetical protein
VWTLNYELTRQIIHRIFNRHRNSYSTERAELLEAARAYIELGTPNHIPVLISAEIHYFTDELFFVIVDILRALNIAESANIPAPELVRGYGFMSLAVVRFSTTLSDYYRR